MFLVYHEFVYGNEGEDKYDLDMLNKDVNDRFSVNFSLVVIVKLWVSRTGNEYTKNSPQIVGSRSVS